MNLLCLALSFIIVGLFKGFYCRLITVILFLIIYYRYDYINYKKYSISLLLFLVFSININSCDIKYGYVNKDGQKIVDCIYDDAKEQNEYGFAAVKKDGKWGAIDTQGNIVCETNYDLDENLLIDFIGKYHLGKDINLLFYTEK